METFINALEASYHNEILGSISPYHEYDPSNWHNSPVPGQKTPRYVAVSMLSWFEPGCQALMSFLCLCWLAIQSELRLQMWLQAVRWVETLPRNMSSGKAHQDRGCCWDSRKCKQQEKAEDMKTGK